jgi:hypothetical protein
VLVKQFGRGTRVEPVESQHRQVPAIQRAGRASPVCDEHCDRIGLQAPADERQRVPG